MQVGYFNKIIEGDAYSITSCIFSLVNWEQKSQRITLRQCFSTFLLERNPLGRFDCSWNPCNDTRVCCIPNGQKQNFSVLSNLQEKNID